jgi:hypothetical protein
MESNPNFITLFVDATIEARYYLYAQRKKKTITINGFVQIRPSDLLQLNVKLIEDYGRIIEGSFEYETVDVNYDVSYKTINRVY